MPAYQYKCDSCSKGWTEYHGFNEEPKKCPFCEQENIKKTYNYESSIKRLEEIPEQKRKPGAKTREFIEQARENLKEHKVDLK